MLYSEKKKSRERFQIGLPDKYVRMKRNEKQTLDMAKLAAKCRDDSPDFSLGPGARDPNTNSLVSMQNAKFV